MIAIIGGDPGDWGFIPGFLDESDPRPAREQIDERYRGGWYPLPGGTFDFDNFTYTYPGDPVLRAISVLVFRSELLFLFPHDFVVIVQPDDTWETSRLD